FLGMALVVSGTALIMAASFPFGGPTELGLVVLVSLLLFWFGAMAWTRARQKRFVPHREWMIRTLGLCFFVAVQRLVYSSFVLTTEWPDRELFLMSNWISIVLVLVAAECWINLTRRPS
ncbi:MAG TPA: DUF2306 domain-containing protein, partial [Nevskiaceae bacterium]|nr:DUF2306 domain-containing protein [Nevskiaceae bacterium]